MKKITKKLILGATFWALLQKVVSYGLSLITFVIMARLLDVADFGAFAAVFLFVHFCDHIAGFGLADGIVQGEDLSDTQFSSIAFLSLGLGFVFALSGFIIGIIHSLWSGGTGMNLLSAASLCLAFAPIIKCFEARYRRQVDLKSVAIRELCPQGLAAALGIVLAVMGYGVWSLLWQAFSVALLKFVLYAYGFRNVITYGWDSAYVRGRLSFGVPLMASKVLGFLSNRGVQFLLALFVDVIALGLYATAQKILSLLNQMFAVVSNQVLYPIFSRSRGDVDNLEKYTLRSIQCSLIFSLPLFMCLSALSPDVIVLVFGSKWLKAGELFMLLALVGIASVQNKIWDSLLVSSGLTKLRLKVQVVNVVIMLISVISVLPYGISAVALVHVFRSYILFIIFFSIASRKLPFKLSSVKKLYLRIFLFSFPLLFMVASNFLPTVQILSEWSPFVLFAASIFYLLFMGLRIGLRRFQVIDLY